MQTQQESRGENRLGQVLRVFREEGPASVARKLVRFCRSRLSVYKSQKGQDRWVLETLRGKRNGFFVDLAASDGVTFNNTWVMEKKYDWTGIAIEANPYFYPRLERSRSCCTLELAVDCEAGSVPFRIDVGGLGGIVADDTENRPAESTHHQQAEIVDIAAKTLTEILAEQDAPSTMDYLSLDVEGAELRVLQGLDFSNYTFLCLTVEQPNEEVKTLLSENGYLFVKEAQLDSFYIHRSHPHCGSIAGE